MVFVLYIIDMIWFHLFFFVFVSIRSHFFTGGIAQVVEHLPIKLTTHSSNQNTAKEKTSDFFIFTNRVT
jgi:hypothetical protein